MSSNKPPADHHDSGEEDITTQRYPPEYYNRQNSGDNSGHNIDSKIPSTIADVDSYDAESQYRPQTSASRAQDEYGSTSRRPNLSIRERMSKAVSTALSRSVGSSSGGGRASRISKIGGYQRDQVYRVPSPASVANANMRDNENRIPEGELFGLPSMVDESDTDPYTSRRKSRVVRTQTGADSRRTRLTTLLDGKNPAKTTQVTFQDENGDNNTRLGYPPRQPSADGEKPSGSRRYHDRNSIMFSRDNNLYPEFFVDLPALLKMYGRRQSVTPPFSQPRRLTTPSSAQPPYMSGAGRAQGSEYLDEEARIGTPGSLPKTSIRLDTMKTQNDGGNMDYITSEVVYQDMNEARNYIELLARAYMMFGGPTHRFEYSIAESARLVGLECSAIYLIDFAILTFHEANGSNVIFIKQPMVPNLRRVTQLTKVQLDVMEENLTVQEGYSRLSTIIRKPPVYSDLVNILIGGGCSVCIGLASFSASPYDVILIAPFGMFLIAAQIFISKYSTELSRVFEVFITAVLSFCAAAAASRNGFCYSSVIGSSIVLVLPGWPAFLAALELQSRSMLCGSIRLGWGLIYAFFLGFGVSLGAQAWQIVSGHHLLFPDGNSSVCTYARLDAPWWRSNITPWAYFLLVPGYVTFIGMRFGAKINTIEYPVMVINGAAGWTAAHFTSLLVPQRADFIGGAGAFVFGFLGNIWARVFNGNSYVVTVPPVLFQLPSGLPNGGVLSYGLNADSHNNSWTSGVSLAQQLILTVIGLTAGLFLSSALVYPRSRKNHVSAF